MRRTLAFAAALQLLAGAALAQSTTITTGPNGELSGSVSTPGAPSIGVQAGNGQVTTTSPGTRRGGRAGGGASSSSSASAYSSGGQAYTSAGPGRSVTVRSPDGSSSSSVSVSGDNAVVAGAGSPGSKVTVSPGPASKRHATTHRRHHRHKNVRHKQ